MMWLGNQPYLMLVIATLFWAANIVLGRYVVGRIFPFALTFIRWSGTFLVLLPFAWPHLKNDWPILRRHLPLMMVMAFAGFTGNNAAAYWGLQHTEALNGLLLQSSGPLFVALWALILFGARLTVSQAIGIVISMAGVLVIVLHGHLTELASITFNIGDVGVVTGLALIGIYSALIPRRPPVHSLSMMALITGLAGLMAIPLMTWEGLTGNPLHINMFTVCVAIFMAIFPSAISYTFYSRSIELIGPNRAAPFFHLIPVFGSVMAVGLLGERFHIFHIAGYALVLTGVVIAARKASAPTDGPQLPPSPGL